ncbi:MAG TPA: YraN family protein [Kiritimatiellia bacterium]|nr:YraN family protein [Kiritimatiellia bacterium]
MRWPWQKKELTRDEQAHRAGLWGEDVAARHLSRKGYRLLGQRVRVGTRDEFDIIARDGNNVLVFVEVKTRKTEEYGRPVSSVNRGKRHSLSRAALRYMKKLSPRPPYFRFDVVEVVGTEDGGDPVVRHLENAFALEAGYRVYW